LEITDQLIQVKKQNTADVQISALDISNSQLQWNLKRLNLFLRFWKKFSILKKII